MRRFSPGAHPATPIPLCHPIAQSYPMHHAVAREPVVDGRVNSYGFRPKRSPHQALAHVRRSVMRRMSTVVDVDLSKYFDTVRHSILLDKIAKRVQDPEVPAPPHRNCSCFGGSTSGQY
jgi:hypothetical protein